METEREAGKNNFSAISQTSWPQDWDRKKKSELKITKRIIIAIILLLLLLLLLMMMMMRVRNGIWYNTVSIYIQGDFSCLFLLLLYTYYFFFFFLWNTGHRLFRFIFHSLSEKKVINDWIKILIKLSSIVNFLLEWICIICATRIEVLYPGSKISMQYMYVFIHCLCHGAGCDSRAIFKWC